MRTIASKCVVSSLVGMCALGAAACGSVSAQPTTDASTVDGAGAGPDAALTWSAFTQVGVDYTDQIRIPVVSGDGLTLYFLAQLSGTDLFDIYSASRATTGDSFGIATPLLNVNVTGEQARYPDVSEDGLELYYSKGDAGPIMVATRSNTSSAFSVPAAVATGVSGNFPSISGNKLSLYYIVGAGGGINGAVMRVTRAAVGQAWSAPAAVTVNGAIQVYSSIDISSDELSLLRAPTLSPLSHNVLISRRADRNAAFDQTEVVPSMDDPSGVAFGSARWANHDTEIWIGQAVNTVEKPFVSRLR